MKEKSARSTFKRWELNGSFFKRAKRYDQWAALPEPPLEDWMELLDAIERRIARRLLKPGEDVRLKKLILENYPEAKF